MAGVKRASGRAAAKPAVAKSAPAAVAPEATADSVAAVSAESAPALAAGPTTSPEPVAEVIATQAAAQPVTEPVEPAPSVDQELVTEDHILVRVTAKQPERRRAGLKFTSAPETVSLGKDDLAKLYAMAGDPMLTVEIPNGPDSYAIVTTPTCRRCPIQLRTMATTDPIARGGAHPAAVRIPGRETRHGLSAGEPFSLT